MGEIDHHRLIMCGNGLDQRRVAVQAQVAETAGTLVDAGDDLEAVVLVGEVEDALAHSAGGAVHDQIGGHAREW